MSGAGGTGGAVMCGANTCGAGQSCCNASCGICTATGGGCIQIECPDGGLPIDASACMPFPAQDVEACGNTPATPHFYRCALTTLPSPCVTRSIGDIINTFCCP